MSLSQKQTNKQTWDVTFNCHTHGVYCVPSTVSRAIMAPACAPLCPSPFPQVLQSNTGAILHFIFSLFPAISNTQAGPIGPTPKTSNSPPSVHLHCHPLVHALSCLPGPHKGLPTGCSPVSSGARPSAPLPAHSPLCSQRSS